MDKRTDLLIKVRNLTADRAIEAMEEYAKQRAQILEEALEEIISLYEEGCARVTFQRAIATGRQKLNRYRNAT